jgi:amino acid transporter
MTLQSILQFIVKNPTLVTVTSTVILAFIGYFVKYLNDLAIARRRDRLDRVNAQLRLLYGPLFALTTASASVWTSFRKIYKPGEPYFSQSLPPTEPELQAWRLWMLNVFMPLNRRMMDAIVSNADLLEGAMPPEFQELVAHVAAYEVVLARWQVNDFSEHVSTNNFPKCLAKKVKGDYEQLRSTQRGLLAMSDLSPQSGPKRTFKSD